VNTTATGAQVTNGDCGSPSISGDGRYVAFYSGSTGLVPGDTNSVNDVFVKSLSTGAITRVSISSAGGRGHNSRGSYNSRDIALSYDGRFVAFTSGASNLVAGDVEGFVDIFVHDRDPDADGVFDQGNGITTRISITPAGAGGNGDCSQPRISADGR